MNKKRYYDVVIIDSGVGGDSHEEGMSISLLDDKIVRTDNFYLDNVGHGTAVSGIIKAHNPDAKCFYVKIFDSENDCINETVLLYALNYICDHIECKIINMSLGITIPTNHMEMYAVCQRLKEKGVILVAAFDNMEVLSYPAAFDNVIGVASSPECKKTTDFLFINHPVVNICAKGGLQRVRWLNRNNIFTQGNSYACAHISGILSQTICDNLEEALHYLQNSAIKKHNGYAKAEPQLMPHIPEGSRAILFPFNKEMHSLVRFSHLLCVNVVDVYDVRQSARVNASTNKLLNTENNQDYIIKNIDTLDWDSFDVFVLGHTDELKKLLGSSDCVDSMILQAYKKGKYIFCFDDVSTIVQRFSLSSDRIYYPNANMNNVDHIPLGMLYRPWIPMIGVFGTTSRQGKYTLQLLLREKFLRDGYSVGQIGTEPSAYLFGMDLCFHFGYHSTTNINRQNMISYLNSEINKISQKGVDIIISGCQSGTVTYDYGNVKYYTFSQTEFMLGTLPDAVILCVNSYDEFDYVARTIQYIESCVDSKVIALVVYPMGYDDKLGRSRLVHMADTEMRQLTAAFSRKYNIPTYVLGKEIDMENLYSHVVSFFTSDSEDEK